LQNGLGTLEDLVIPEAENAYAFERQCLRPFGIVGDLFGFGVRAAVQFHGESGFMAVEIKNISPERVLAAELEAQELAVAKQLPKELLCLRGVPAQLAYALEQFRR